MLFHGQGALAASTLIKREPVPKSGSVTVDQVSVIASALSESRRPELKFYNID